MPKKSRNQLLKHYLWGVLSTVLILTSSMLAYAHTIEVTGTVRDFSDAHPDFEVPGKGLQKKCVKDTLSQTGTPVASATVDKCVISKLEEWYSLNHPADLTTSYQITLDNGKTEPGGIYTFKNNSFFPIDEQLGGNQGRSHNYHFTFNFHFDFVYQPGQTLTFSGDDDVWVFINKQLVVDLGGMHVKKTQNVTSKQLNELGLVPGEVYPFDFFFAERHTKQSNFELTLSHFEIEPEECPFVAGTDVMIGDTPASGYQGIDDQGGEPDPNMTGQQMWKSKHLWIRNQANNPGSHQNPIYNQENEVYVQVQNRGGQTASNVKITAYWGEPATGLKWPDHWNKITTVTLDKLESCTSRDVPISWFPPKPLGGNGHFCLFAVIEADDDPITHQGPEFVHPGKFVRHNNNVAWRNVHVVSLPPKYRTSITGFIARNINPQESVVRLELQATDCQGQVVPMTAGTVLKLGTIAKEQVKGYQGGKLETIEEPLSFTVTEDDKPVYLDIQMAANEKQNMQAYLNVPVEQNCYLLDVTQNTIADSDTIIADGGVQYQLSIAENLTTDLAITKTVPATVAVDDTFDYTITVTNQGPDNAHNVQLEDTLPEGIQWVSVNPSAECHTDKLPTLTCQLGPLAVNTSKTIEVKVTATTIGTWESTARVSAATSDNNAENDNMTVSIQVNSKVEVDCGVKSITRIKPEGIIHGLFNTQAKLNNNQVAKKVEFKITDTDNNLIETYLDNKSPYRFPARGKWDTTQVNDGQYTLTVSVYDQNDKVCGQKTVPLIIKNNLEMGSCETRGDDDLVIKKWSYSYKDGKPIKAVAIVKNNSAVSYRIALASYEQISDNLAEQLFFKWSGQQIIAPGEKVTLTTLLPNCRTEINLFCGKQLVDFTEGDRYDQRLITKMHIAGHNNDRYCYTPTEPPSSGTPAESSSCQPKGKDIELNDRTLILVVPPESTSLKECTIKCTP